MAVHALATWKTMEKKELRHLATAVFFLFATIGPLTLLMEPSIIQASWMRLAVMTVLSGLFSASIILSLAKPFRIILSVAVYSLIMIFLSKAKPDFFHPDVHNVILTPDTSFRLSSEQLSDVRTKRTVFGLTAIFCLSTGYILFIRTVTREYKRRTEIETEVKIAQSIHASLLPKSSVTTEWCDIAGVSLPATEIGGDFYDIIKLSETKMLLVIADASGHGTGAGILSAMTKSSIMQELQHTHSPAELLNSVNKTIFAVTEKQKFITCALALLDKDKSSAEIVTAGHPQILRRTGNAVEEFRTHHLALGMQAGASFTTQTIPLMPGDTLYFITDGILEASNPKHEHFGMERLHRWILKKQYTSAQQCSDELIGAIRSFTVTKELYDDATIVVAAFR